MNNFVSEESAKKNCVPPRSKLGWETLSFLRLKISNLLFAWRHLWMFSKDSNKTSFVYRKPLLLTRSFPLMPSPDVPSVWPSTWPTETLRETSSLTLSSMRQSRYRRILDNFQLIGLKLHSFQPLTVGELEYKTSLVFKILLPEYRT